MVIIDARTPQAHLQLEHHRPVVVGKSKKSGRPQVKSGKPVNGPTLPAPLARAMVEVGLLEIEQLNTKERPVKTLGIALTLGVADGSTAKVGAKSHHGPDNGSPSPVVGTAAIDKGSQKSETENERRLFYPPLNQASRKRWRCKRVGVCFIRLSSNRGGIRLSVSLMHCFSFCDITL